jgi:hypothetical protein
MKLQKRAPAPYQMDRYGIANPWGDIWTPETFDTMDAARRYIDNYAEKNRKMDMSRHKVVRVAVTVRAIQ